jgi:hypothetical protein
MAVLGPILLHSPARRHLAIPALHVPRPSLPCGLALLVIQRLVMCVVAFALIGALGLAAGILFGWAIGQAGGALLLDDFHLVSPLPAFQRVFEIATQLFS